MTGFFISNKYSLFILKLLLPSHIIIHLGNIRNHLIQFPCLVKQGEEIDVQKGILHLLKVAQPNSDRAKTTTQFPLNLSPVFLLHRTDLFDAPNN